MNSADASSGANGIWCGTDGLLINPNTIAIDRTIIRMRMATSEEDAHTHTTSGFMSIAIASVWNG
jgi:hypothetical protein